MIITAGKFKGRKIKAPDENVTRPTLSKIRMGVFNTLQAMINFDNASFLDMYAGSGIMGLEALSRGFECAVAIEKDKKSANVIKSNFKIFEIAPKLLIGDSIKIVMSLRNFDVVYIDPPYFAGIYEKSLDAVKNIAKIIVLEHVTDVNFDGFKVIKQKKYGDKLVTFLQKK